MFYSKEIETKSKANLKRKKMHMYSDKLSDYDSDLNQDEESKKISLKKTKLVFI